MNTFQITELKTISAQIKNDETYLVALNNLHRMADYQASLKIEKIREQSGIRFPYISGCAKRSRLYVKIGRLEQKIRRLRSEFYMRLRAY